MMRAWLWNASSGSCASGKYAAAVASSPAWSRPPPARTRKPATSTSPASGLRAHFQADQPRQPAFEPRLFPELAQGAFFRGLAVSGSRRAGTTCPAAGSTARRTSSSSLPLVEHHDRRRRHRVLVGHGAASRAVVRDPGPPGGASPFFFRSAGRTACPSRYSLCRAGTPRRERLPAGLSVCQNRGKNKHGTGTGIGAAGG